MKNEIFSWFEDMIDHCYDYATSARKKGKPIIGITCEYTPRELIMAAGAIPVCLCGGSFEMISPAEKDLPANLCPLIKSTYGYLVEKANPFLEMADLVVAETTCDGKKKMYEIMAEKKPVYVLELTQKENDRDALKHWTAELRKLQAELEKRLRVKITDDKIRQAIKIMNRERGLRRSLAELMKKQSPPFTGRHLLEMKSIISGNPADFRQYEKAIKIFSKSPGQPGLSKRTRVLVTGVPMVHGAERIVDIIESYGGLVVCMENCTGLKPILEDVEEKNSDPIRSLAEKYFHNPCSVMTKNTRRIDSLRKLVKEYKPQCIIEVVWQNCLTYDVESFYIKRFARNEAHIPYLKIQTDYSPSDSGRLAVRIEALFETIRKT